VGGSGWRAAVPFALAWSFAAATLNASLAPASLDERRFEETPQPQPSPPATHHDEMEFDSSELISV
jgi:hypothetical protein